MEEKEKLDIIYSEKGQVYQPPDWSVGIGEVVLEGAFILAKIKDKKLEEKIDDFHRRTIFESPHYPKPHPECKELAEILNEKRITNIDVSLSSIVNCSVNRAPYSPFEYKDAWGITIEGGNTEREVLEKGRRKEIEWV